MNLATHKTRVFCFAYGEQDGWSEAAVRSLSDGKMIKDHERVSVCYDLVHGTLHPNNSLGVSSIESKQKTASSYTARVTASLLKASNIVYL